jgi:hypothetical protein
MLIFPKTLFFVILFYHQINFHILSHFFYQFILINKMRNLLTSLFLVVTVFLLSGCYDTFQEITIDANGTGTYTSTSDMSALIGLVKQMGGEKEMEKAGDQKIDSTISLAEGAGEMTELNDQEKNLAIKGKLHIQVDLKNEQFITAVSFPFNSTAEIPAIINLSNKILTGALKEQMNQGTPADSLGEMPAPSSVDDYYVLQFSDGLIERKLNKEKYAAADSDQFLMGIMQASSMGLDMNTSYTIHLPRPATRVEGKNVKLSDDKMSLTLKAGLGEFYDNPSLLEFRIEY